MAFRQHGEGVGADLVRDVAIGGYAVGADHDHVDLAFAHEVPGHAVGDEGAGNAFPHQLPCRKPRALQVGSGLVRDHRNIFML